MFIAYPVLKNHGKIELGKCCQVIIVDLNVYLASEYILLAGLSGTVRTYCYGDGGFVIVTHTHTNLSCCRSGLVCKVSVAYDLFLQNPKR